MRVSVSVHRGRDQPKERPSATVLATDAVSREQEKITAVLIGQAQAQVAATLANADSHDTKALGLLGADIAGVALLLSNHGALNRFWWVSLFPAFLSAAGFAWTLMPRSFATGPAIDDLYRDTIAGPALDANVAVLDALTQAIEDNRRVSDRKRVGWALGAVVMATATVLCTAYLLVVR